LLPEKGNTKNNFVHLLNARPYSCQPSNLCLFSTQIRHFNLHSRLLIKLVRFARVSFHSRTILLSQKQNSSAKSDDVNQNKLLLDRIIRELNIKNNDEIYNINFQKEFTEKGGDVLLHQYNNNPYSMISSLYPNYSWLPWKFTVPYNYWNDINNKRQFVEWASQQLNIKDKSDWYNVTVKV
jgi:hypothetical protein